MIAWLKEKFVKNKNLINVSNLKNNVALLNKFDDIYAKYIIDLYNEHINFIEKNNSPSFILDTISIDYTSKKEDDILYLSPSHDNTYFIIKKINENKNRNIIIVCFDMHCDCYSNFDSLWKGNVFTKLIIEGYINKLIVVGIPTKKIDVTKQDIDDSVKEKVVICTDYNQVLLSLSKEQNAELYVSVDIDCLNTREGKYTALEYTSFNILSEFSKNKLEIINESEIKNYIFIKNKLGYSNLYEAGDYGLSVDELQNYILKLKENCIELNHTFGIVHNNKKYCGDITEINGYDYSNLTKAAIMKIIDIIIAKEVI